MARFLTFSQFVHVFIERTYTQKVNKFVNLNTTPRSRTSPVNRVPSFVEDEIHVAERVVDDVKADVRAELISFDVVLEEGVQKSAAGEGVEDFEADEGGDEGAGGHLDVVPAVTGVDLPRN